MTKPVETQPGRDRSVVKPNTVHPAFRFHFLIEFIQLNLDYTALFTIEPSQGASQTLTRSAQEQQGQDVMVVKSGMVVYSSG